RRPARRVFCLHRSGASHVKSDSERQKVSGYFGRRVRFEQPYFQAVCAGRWHIIWVFVVGDESLRKERDRLREAISRPTAIDLCGLDLLLVPDARAALASRDHDVPGLSEVLWRVRFQMRVPASEQVPRSIPIRADGLSHDTHPLFLLQCEGEVLVLINRLEL